MVKNKMSTNKNNTLHVTPVHLPYIYPNEKILEKVLKNGDETEFQDYLIHAMKLYLLKKKEIIQLSL